MPVKYACQYGTMQVKFATEKRLHEIIRDLPEAAKVNKALERGVITLDEALSQIALIIKAER